MKKVLLLMTVAVMTLTASAQIYLGGEVGFWRQWANGANKTNFSVLPEIGYNLNENWAVGTVIGYMYEYEKGAKCNEFQVAPYARYTFLKLDNVNLFLDGGFAFDTYKWKGGDSYHAWEFGVKPGVSVNLTPKLSFISHFGFLGYVDTDKDMDSAFGTQGFGLNLKPNNITFGLYWNF